MERIGIFGGTFNPVHSGHLLLARHYLDALKLDRLLVIPTGTPPHKDAPELLDGEKRMQLCALAFEDQPRVQLCDIELRREGKSFTVDTVGWLRQQYPQAQLYLLVGSDMFLSFERWKSWQQILQQVTLCTAARSSGELLQLRRHARAADALRQYAGVRFSGAGSFFHPNPSTAQGRAGLFAAAARKGISADFAAKLIQRVTPCKKTDMCRPSGNCCIKRGLTIR